MKVFLIITGVVVAVALLIFLLTGKRWRKVVGFFVEELDENGVPSNPVRLPSFSFGKEGRKSARSHTQPQGTPSSRRNPHQSYTEMAVLMQKIDERRRVVDSSGHSTLYDEYFELVFETRKRGTLRLEASRAAFKEVPFNQEGVLTYKNGVLIKFKYAGGLISDEYSSREKR